MKLAEHNTITGNGFIKLTGEVLEIDKDWLSDLIGEEIANLSGSNHLNIIKDVEVASDVNDSYTLCVEATVCQIGYITIDFDDLSLVSENSLNFLVIDDLFMDQCISKAEFYINGNDN